MHLPFQHHAFSKQLKNYSSINDLPPTWIQEYHPINNQWWSNFINLITIDEFLEILTDLSYNKASGPLGITYKDFKHSDPSVLIKLKPLKKFFFLSSLLHLNNIFSHNILQPNNQADLKGQSSFKPLVNIQHVIESANFTNSLSQHKKNRSHLWHAIQDLSKAYDRVNIILLCLTLLRIKMQYTIVDFICQAFTD
ncbi:hypothetical protein RclHR1_09100002 [Rhizophagus clarus]|uniref:Reverse transcriptase domain-containing protein n=1 Tax=Rhizophagus clarus TaxID=94130 RepID=A0A2Z6SPV4_9GLOM|nr:hypothetical protein RclHR1_09100002 [Rhizophagus clarus]